MARTFKSLGVLALSGGFVAAFAAPGSIGIVQSSGEFRVGNAAIFGNGTVFEGDRVETMGAASVVQLPGHAQLTLGPVSRAEVFQDHSVLVNGTETIKAAEKHTIEVASLRVSPASKDSVVDVEVTAPGLVAVSARTGSAFVRNQAGVLLASVRPGLAFAFTPQGGATSSVKITGIIQKRGDQYFITDETTHMTVELRPGQLPGGLNQYVGKRADVFGSQIPGATPAGGASQVILVSNVGVLTAPVHTGLSGGAKAGIVAGVVGGGAIAGVAATRGSSSHQ